MEYVNNKIDKCLESHGDAMHRIGLEHGRFRALSEAIAVLLNDDCDTVAEAVLLLTELRSGDHE